MSLLVVPEEDLKKITKVYSKLIGKYKHNNALRSLWIARRRFYTKELDARGILWRKNGVRDE